MMYALAILLLMLTFFMFCLPLIIVGTILRLMGATSSPAKERSVKSQIISAQWDYDRMFQYDRSTKGK